EAAIELPVRDDVERRRLLLMERAKPDVAAARLLQRHACLDHLDDVDAREQIVDEGLRDEPRHAAECSARLSTPPQRTRAAAGISFRTGTGLAAKRAAYRAEEERLLTRAAP